MADCYDVCNTDLFYAFGDIECPLFFDHLKFDENGRKFSKPVENSIGIGEIARYKQFLLSHSVFKRLVLQTRVLQKTSGIVWERVKRRTHENQYQTI